MNIKTRYASTCLYSKYSGGQRQGDLYESEAITSKFWTPRGTKRDSLKKKKKEVNIKQLSEVLI